MRRTISILTVLALVAVLALAVVACGSDDSSGASTEPAPTTTLSPEQLVKQSEAETAKVKSGSFTADLALKTQGDTSKMDATAQAMLGQGLTVKMAGKSSSSPVAIDMTMSLGIAGQTMEFAMMAQGDKAWIQYQGKWYEVDQQTLKGLSGQATEGAAPTQRLKSMGVDPTAWDATYELAGTEQLDGTWTYHVKATVEPQKIADSLMKALEDPAIAKQLGQNGKELEKSLKDNKKDLRQLRKSLKNTTADFWIGADDMLMRKVTMAVDLDMTGQTDDDLQGVGAVNVTGALTMSDFGEPVTVTPPADALPFSQLMNSFFGGLMGGMMGGGSSLSL